MSWLLCLGSVSNFLLFGGVQKIMVSFYFYTVLAGFNEFGFNELSRFNESIFEVKYFFAS